MEDHRYCRACGEMMIAREVLSKNYDPYTGQKIKYKEFRCSKHKHPTFWTYSQHDYLLFADGDWINLDGPGL